MSRLSITARRRRATPRFGVTAAVSVLRRSRAIWLFSALAAVGCLLHPPMAQAAVVEEVITAPVSLNTIYGGHHQEIVVTVFRDDQRQASPYLVLNHGRVSNEKQRMKQGRQRYSEISRYFVSLGVSVLVPTRIGYGVTGGPDVEYSGPCADKDYAPGYDAAADEVEAVLRRVRTLPSVDLSSGIVVGTSFGGMTAIKLSTRSLPGLAAAVNFSGGVGGNPKTHPQNPCGADRLDDLYRSYGAAAKVPSLWLYSPNDRFWGPRLPRQWFRSFTAAGGQAEFVELPRFGEDGHKSFAGNSSAWKPAFERFLRKIGFLDAAPQAGR
jgi:dienelactone hydrolase